MTERRARYIVTVGNVIHGAFPVPSERPLFPGPALAPDEISYRAQPVQMELNLTGGHSAHSRPREDVPRRR